VNARPAAAREPETGSGGGRSPAVVVAVVAAVLAAGGAGLASRLLRGHG
jgi:hypothetical protein